MSSKSTTGDLTFKSASEIQSFVRHQLEQPGYTGSGSFSERASQNPFFRKNLDGTFRNLQGKDVFDDTKIRNNINSLVFRNFFNPLDYNGQLIRELKKAYLTNELGFAIGVTFFFAISWSFMTHRRNTLLESKKRFVY